LEQWKQHNSLIEGTNVVTKALNNVVGVLAGKKCQNEYVVFSLHYDHLGVSHQPKESNMMQLILFTMVPMMMLRNNSRNHVGKYFKNK
jgi:hypothetical protein